MRHALLLLAFLVACGPRSPQPVIASSPTPDARPDGSTAYDPAWGHECHIEGPESPFGTERTIELVNCAVDPPPPDDEARPRDWTAYLVVRHTSSEIIATTELGRFNVWEEGKKWILGGAIESAGGATAAFATYFSGGMAMDSGTHSLHVYAFDGTALTDAIQLEAPSIEVVIAPDRRSATLEVCRGACGYPPGETTSERIDIRFAGPALRQRRLP